MCSTVRDGLQSTLLASPQTNVEAQVEAWFRKLQKSKRDLFNPNKTEVRIETVMPRENQSPRPVVTDTIVDSSQLQATLRNHLSKKGDTFIYLFLDYSWAPLNISVEAARQLVGSIEAGTDLLELFDGFGHPESGYRSDFSGGYNSYCISSSLATDTPDGRMGLNAGIAYALQYIAKTGRSNHPWSERKMGIYHKLRSSSSTWLIIQPTLAALSLPKALSTSHISQSLEALLPHIYLLRASLPAWKSYLGYLEARIRENSRKIRLIDEKSGIILKTSSVQDLQYHSELLHNTISDLRCNLETLSGLELLIATEPGPSGTAARCDLASCASHFRMNQKWAEDMLERTKEISNLMAMLVYAKHSTILSANTTLMASVSDSTKSTQDMMLVLAQATKEDSGIMRWLATATTICLPFSLITALFSTGFMQAYLTSDSGNTATLAKVQASIYAALTFTLTSLAIILSFLWNQKRQLNATI